MLSSKADFTALFPVGSQRQVRYDSDKLYWPDQDDNVQLAPNDYPRCRITQRGLGGQTEDTSNGSTVLVAYDIEVCTGQMQQGPLMDADWAILQGLLWWREYLLAMEWNGTYPIRDANSRKCEEKDDNKERNRGTYQWVSLWTLELTFVFSTSLVKSVTST
jgi:hypothetical protein